MAGPAPSFGLPEDVLAVLPDDPFELLDVARKVTSIALATRLEKMEEEGARLRQELAEKEEIVAELRARLETLDASLGEISEQLARADDEKEALRSENVVLANTVKKLNRDVSKLEVFKKTLMQSLQEDDENPNAGSGKPISNQLSNSGSYPPLSVRGEVDDALPPPAMPLSKSQVSETGSSISDGSSLAEPNGPKQMNSKGPISKGLLLASQTSTPRITPPDSPTRHSAAGSPTKGSKPTSPRRHSISVFSSARNVFDERSSVFSSLPSNHHSSMTGPFDTGAQTGWSQVLSNELHDESALISALGNLMLWMNGRVNS